MQALLNDFEFQYLEVLADPVRTVQTMLVARLLSNHSKDEEYLSEPSSPWLTVSLKLIPMHGRLCLLA